jgi:hypothetical protein
MQLPTYSNVFQLIPTYFIFLDTNFTNEHTTVRKAISRFGASIWWRAWEAKFFKGMGQGSHSTARRAP